MSIVHTTIKASDLRPGDVIRIGTSENYVLAYEIIPTGSGVAVWASDGAGKAALGPSLRLRAGDRVLVSRRDYRPWEG
jgi:hypothetical protein